MRPAEIDPDKIYTLKLRDQDFAHEILHETGEVLAENHDPTEYTREIRVTGRQLLNLLKRIEDGGRARLGYVPRDEQMSVGDDDELIVRESAVPDAG